MAAVEFGPLMHKLSDRSTDSLSDITLFSYFYHANMSLTVRLSPSFWHACILVLSFNGNCRNIFWLALNRPVRNVHFRQDRHPGLNFMTFYIYNRTRLLGQTLSTNINRKTKMMFISCVYICVNICGFMKLQ